MSIKTYRKRPVEVEVLYFDGTNLDEVIEFVGRESIGGGHRVLEKSYFYIRTLEGNMNFDKNYYLIKGVEGEFYPCAAHIFEKTYEIVK